MATSTSTVGDNVRAELARRRLSQQELAAHLGISQSQLSKRLNDRIDFGVTELGAVAAFLDIPIGALLPDPVVAQSAAS
jgi:transcriptional regulator with XRE-family HTH domain